MIQMARWHLHLIVLGIGLFFVNAGMTMIIPFLPLYLQELGVTDPHQVAAWASVIFAANFFTAFLFQPVWGNLADRYGRKLMVLRSGFGMAAVMTLMGFAGGPWQLLMLRIVNGVVSGFAPASIALMSAGTPKDKIGFTMGTLQSSVVAGTIFGPLFGGFMADHYGYRPIFFITGSLIFIASLLALLLVKEPVVAEKTAKREATPLLRAFRPLFGVRELNMLNTTTVVIQFALLAPVALLPLFVQELSGQAGMVAFYAGVVSSVNGLSNMIAAPLLGRLGDRIGSGRILLFCLLGSALLSLPQAFVHSTPQLIAVRFALGVCMGGLLPSVNALIGRYAPPNGESMAYSLNSSMYALGSMLGPLVGGFVSESLTIRGVFVISSLLLAACALWLRGGLRAPAPDKPEPAKGVR
jgi:MFS family permease